MSEKLKPCPFCGGEARTHHMKGYDLWEVSCGQCGVELSAYMCEKDAVNAWNRRTEPERKKGKWIKVHGYATPGGDPVWKCSECGKGIHVYGIEAPSYNRDYTDGHQWVACPNCGADMRGENGQA